MLLAGNMHTNQGVSTDPGDYDHRAVAFSPRGRGPPSTGPRGLKPAARLGAEKHVLQTLIEPASLADDYRFAISNVPIYRRASAAGVCR